MALPARPPLASSYAANVVLVILTLFPGLINTSAIALAAPVIGGDLGVAANVAAALPLLSDAALAFGCVLGSELARRCSRRVVYFWLIAVSLATSLASAIAPTFAVLLVAHVVHGLVAGMLFIVILPPLLTSFGSAKLRATATVMVPALFGAATLGPLLGALVAAPGAWRSIFAAEVVVAAIAYGLAPFVLERGAPPVAEDPVDWFALIFAALGSSFVYVGVGALAGSDWRNPAATGPVAIGLLLYAALVAGEAVATGFAFWPEFLAALASGFLFGRLVTTRWVVLCGAAGLIGIATAAAIARALAPVTPGASMRGSPR